MACLDHLPLECFPFKTVAVVSRANLRFMSGPPFFGRIGRIQQDQTIANLDACWTFRLDLIHSGVKRVSYQIQRQVPNGKDFC